MVIVAKYCSSHFVKGKLPERLKEVGTRLFSAPVTNPRSRSVDRIERNVQLTQVGLLGPRKCGKKPL